MPQSDLSAHLALDECADSRLMSEPTYKDAMEAAQLNAAQRCYDIARHCMYAWTVADRIAEEFGLKSTTGAADGSPKEANSHQARDRSA